MKSLLRVLIVSALGVTAPAWAATGAVTGTVNFLQRFALPADALLEVRLEDTTRADAAATTIARTAIAAAGTPAPIPFRIEFDPAAIDTAHRYSIRATIASGGRVLYASARAHPVLTQGAGNDIAIEVYLLLPAQGATIGAARPDADCENRDWKLVAFGDAPAIAAPGTRKASVALHPAERRLIGSPRCNRLAASYDLAHGAQARPRQHDDDGPPGGPDAAGGLIGHRAEDDPRLPDFRRRAGTRQCAARARAIHGGARQAEGRAGNETRAAVSPQPPAARACPCSRPETA
jgi:putative lipoprotein